MTNNALKLTPVALLLSALVGCGGDNPPAEQSAPNPNSSAAPSTPSGQPVYRVGVETPYPPYIQMDGKGGYEGFDVDVLTEIGKREGFAIEYKPNKWDGLLDLLNTDTIDIVASGVFDTPERRSKYGLSAPYYSEAMVLITSKDSSAKNFEDVIGKKVAYVSGSVIEELLIDLEKGKKPDPSFAKGNSWQVIKSLTQKETDLAMDTSSTYAYYAKQYPDLGLRIIYQDTPEWLDIVFAVKQDNQELLGKLNKGIASIKADGTYDKIKDKWFSYNTNTKMTLNGKSAN